VLGNSHFVWGLIGCFSLFKNVHGSCVLEVCPLASWYLNSRKETSEWGAEACITSILPACSSKDMIYCYVARCSKEALILITGVGWNSSRPHANCCVHLSLVRRAMCLLAAILATATIDVCSFLLLVAGLTSWARNVSRRCKNFVSLDLDVTLLLQDLWTGIRMADKEGEIVGWAVIACFSTLSWRKSSWN